MGPDTKTPANIAAGDTPKPDIVSKIRIILIEDNDDDAYLIEDALDERHRLLHRFSDGQEALEALESGNFSPDIILVDFRLPSMDGVEIIKALSSGDGEVRSFIMLTADTRIETAIEAMKAGARDFHPKTWGFDTLPDAIERVYRIHKELVERREFQLALHRSERLLNFAIDQMPIPIVLADADSGNVRHVNEPARKLSMLDEDDEKPISIEDLAKRIPFRKTPTSPPDRSLNPLFTAFKEGKAVRGLELHLSRDGADHWVSASAAPLYDESGDAIAVVGAFPDITEQKEASLQLEEINASKDRFFSIIGHDLRNPANQISMALQIILTRFDEQPREKIKLYLDRIQHGSDNLIRLLDSLLQWGRLQTNNIDFFRQEIRLASAIRENVAGFLMAADRKSIDLISECPDDLSAYGDLHMFNAIIRNLISNAIKFTPSQGKVEVWVHQEGEMISTVVHDTGVGIPPERLPSLFEVSEDKIRSGTDGERGTGLGLMFCKDLAKKNDAYIDANSTVGKGTTITVKFPKFVPARHAVDTENQILRVIR